MGFTIVFSNLTKITNKGETTQKRPDNITPKSRKNIRNPLKTRFQSARGNPLSTINLIGCNIINKTKLLKVITFLLRHFWTRKTPIMLSRAPVPDKKKSPLPVKQEALDLKPHQAAVPVRYPGLFEPHGIAVIDVHTVVTY